LISFDTNLLVYAADRDAGRRHQHAVDLMENAIHRGSCIQTLQSLGEFYNAVTRKIGIAPEDARMFVDGWCAVFPIEAASVIDLEQAMRAANEHKLAFWDALLWATVRRAGVGVLISEDFQDGRVIDGVRIANPFVASNAEVIETALRS
jgi:predicted nucleic acid-binding protein